MSTTSNWFILDAQGVVVGASVGNPPAEAVPAGGSTRDADTCPPGAGLDWRLVAGVLQPPGYTGPLSQTDLLAYAATRRLQIEEGGITMPDGRAVKTDRESQGLIDRAVSLAAQFPDEPIDFKASSGWVTLDAPTMLVIGRTVGLHVRRMFTRERAADAAIAAGTATTLADVERILSTGA